MRVGHIPALVGRDVAQAEVGGEVDDAHAALEQRRDGRRGAAVRVGDDRGVGLGAIGVELLELERDAVVGVEVGERRARRPRAR